MAVPPIIALKAAGTTQGALQKSLTGDIYTKTWSEVVGRGKKAKVVEKTVHVNPVGIGLGALAVGAAATAAVGALWLAQLKLTPTRHQTYKTVVDSPARHVEATGHYEATGTGTIVGRGYSAGAMRWVQDSPAYDVPAVTHREPTGKSTLRFAIEQRQPFTISDLLPNPVNAFKEATGLDKPVFGDWSKGKIFARKWW